MPNLKISELPAGTTTTGVEELPAVQGGVTKRFALDLLVAAVNNQLVEAEADRAMSVEADLLQQIQSLAVGTGQFVSDTDPRDIPGVTVANNFLWYGETNGKIQRFDDGLDDWVTIVIGPPGLDASQVVYDSDLGLPTVLDAIVQLFSEYQNLDVPGQRRTHYDSEVFPGDLGHTMLLRDTWWNPVTRFLYEMCEDPDIVVPGSPVVHIDGALIDSGNIALARIAAALATGAFATQGYVDAAVAAQLGLTPEQIDALTALAGELAGGDIGTLLALVETAVQTDAAGTGELYLNGGFGDATGISIATLAASLPFTSSFSPLSFPPNVETGPYTIASADLGLKSLAHNSASLAIWTVPTHATDPIPTGRGSQWKQLGTGQIAFVPEDPSVIIVSEGDANVSTAKGASGVIYKETASRWWLDGSLTG